MFLRAAISKKEIKMYSAEQHNNNINLLMLGYVLIVSVQREQKLHLSRLFALAGNGLGYETGIISSINPVTESRRRLAVTRISYRNRPLKRSFSTLRLRPEAARAIIR